MQSFVKDMLGLSKNGYVSTFRASENCMCRALVQEDGEIISTLDCWNTGDSHPQPYFQLSEQIRGYPHLKGPQTLEERVAEYADYPLMKRFEIKL
jgi:hypothetical protein